MTTREVVLDGGSPWGFRLHGGADVQQPLRISRVNPGSKAALRGIREGDFITSINGQPTKDLSNSEAHNLLKNSGDCLRLGLNEDCTETTGNNGSPKRRQYKTVHQETHSETVRRSSVTSYTTLTSSKSKITSETEADTSKANRSGNIIKVVNGTNSKPTPGAVSQRSTLSSNSSTHTEEGGMSGRGESRDSVNVSDVKIMSDNANASTRSSRRRRARNQRNKKLISNTQPITVTTIEESPESLEVENPPIYRVEYPKPPEKPKPKSKLSPVKSKSLDDDEETIKIQELSEVTSESEDKSDCNKAIVSEAESDWEQAEDLDETTQIQQNTTSSLTLPLMEHSVSEEVSVISPEDELNLRNFLEGLNLVNSPEDAAKQVEKSTLESMKARKAKKREALEQYFFPIIQNPRFLDVISEETSDLSDKEQQSVVTHHLKQGTPENDLPPSQISNSSNNKPPRDLKKRENKNSKMQKRMQTRFCAPVSNPAILVGTKITEIPVVKHEICSSTVAQPNIVEAELVYLEDSSNSTTPDPQSDHEDETEIKTFDVVSSTSSSAPDLLEDSNNSQEIEITVEKSRLGVSVRKNDVLVSETRKISDEETKSLKGSEKHHETQIISTELTPPPTPDNISPNEVLGEDNNFAKTAISNLSDRNFDGIREVIKNPLYRNLPGEIRTKIETSLIKSPSPKSDREVEDLLVLPVLAEIISVNVTSPSASLPSPSPSLSSGSSSRATSLCTTILYNPNSSIGDIMSISKDEEFLEKTEVSSLRELCLNYLMSQPFGVDVLQELAEVSSSIEAFTNNLPVPQHTSAKLPAFIVPKTDATNGRFDVPADSEMLPAGWVGLPTEDERKILLCLSPTQKEQLERTEKTPNEAGNLLDLHEKFTNRSICNNESHYQEQKRVEITSIGNNRLLAIIRNEPDNVNKSSTLPARVGKEDPQALARLKARDLTEWLHLARNKSTSESDLTCDPKFTANESSAMLPRRTSLCDSYSVQMQSLLEKEREIQRELERLEDDKRKLAAEMAPSRKFDAEDFKISKMGDYAESKAKKRPTSMPAVTSTEVFRQRMYEEYMGQVAARQERKQLKVIKVTSTPEGPENAGIAPLIEDEFMDRVKEKQKSGKLLSEEEADEKSGGFCDSIEEDEPVLVMDGERLKEAHELPKHLQEFVDLAKLAAENIDGGPMCGRKCCKEARRINRVLSKNRQTNINGNLLHEIDSALVAAKGFLLCRGVWSPGQKQDSDSFHHQIHNTSTTPRRNNKEDEPILPVWTPKSATSSPTVERKEFRPVKFESPVLGRKSYSRSESAESWATSEPPAPRKAPESAINSDTGLSSSSTLPKRLPTSHSSPASGFGEYSTSRLPKVQNPTITLLQKAREGQLPKGASYIQNDRPPLGGPGENLYQIKHEYASESDSEKPRRMADLGPRNVAGIGPTTKDGMPLILRSEVKDANQSRWYKKMYDTIHKQRPHRDEYVTVRYKQKRGQYPYCSGYLSEPEPGAYDSDYADYKYATLDRRRLPPKEYDYTMSSTLPTSRLPTTVLQTKNIQSASGCGDSYQMTPPGRIENYRPGHSSISDKEAKEWWDEVMDIFDGWLDDNSALPSYDYMFARALARSHLEQQKRAPPQHQQQQQPRSFINQALKESGYESDSTLIFRRRDDTAQQLNPIAQKEAYKVIQKGGDVPLHGLRKPAPERPKDDTDQDSAPTLYIKPQKEIFCYPVTVHPHPSTVFANYKRTAPSQTSSIPKPPPMPPSPPRRRSSRNNSTLRLISTMKVKTEKLPICKRHETCFTSTSNISDNTKVKYLRDKITCKLSPKDGGKSSRLRVSKTVTTSPEIRSRITSTISSSSGTKIRAQSQRCCPSTSGKKCKRCATLTRKATEERPKTQQTTRGTFGSEKRKVDLVLPKADRGKLALVSSPDLLSPTEVKKAVPLINQSKTLPSGTVYKKSTAVLSSVKNHGSSSKDAAIPIRVGISDKAKAILKSTVVHKSAGNSPILPRTRFKSLSPVPGAKKVISTIGRNSPTTSRSLRVSKSTSSVNKLPLSSVEPKKLKKSKKELINGQIASKSKELVFEKNVKCAGRAAGSEMAKKLKEMDQEFGSTSTLAEIRKQRDAIQSDFFFQHLFLRDLPSPTPSLQSRNSWIIERTSNLRDKRRSSSAEPTISAMKVYLQHTKPVSDSKFKSLDSASRSRSVSPKSVTWESDSSIANQPLAEKRGIMHFSQTTRPISPKVERRLLNTPPQSPKLSRSPSSRKIMQLRGQTGETIYRGSSPVLPRRELSLYSCPSSLSQSTSSIDSCYDRKEYQTYIRELLGSTRKSNRFKDLNEFYSTIEKYGQLEKSIHLKPRGHFEDEIIDYDRWKEVRTRERAERELRSIVIQLKEDQKEKGFLFSPKKIDRWRRDTDRGLRIKEKSVENIKEEFERIKREESDRENAKRRELSSLKDTYKPLWRGDSVLGLANKMVERRSHSEGRVGSGSPSARQKLIDSERMLTHGIGSRLWSSLSSEQVNILKNQLTEIYGQSFANKNREDYTIQVLPSQSYNYRPNLTIRRNSDTYSDYSARDLSESDKKLLSRTISKEVLDHVSKRKSEIALPLVLAKETRGATAAADANLKSLDEFEPQKALIKTDVTTLSKFPSASETESGSTDESCKTVIYVGSHDNKDEIKKKVDYFENAAEIENYTPTIYKPYDTKEDDDDQEEYFSRIKPKSQSYQNLKEYFGEKELAKFATIPLAATRPTQYISPQRPQQLLRLRTPSPPISETTTADSFYRSRSLSPKRKEPLALLKTGEVRRLKDEFEYKSGTYPPRRTFLKPRRTRSDPSLDQNPKFHPGLTFGDVEFLRRKYEFPAYSGRGRSRIRRGVVSPTFLKAEDRFMPHINIISKIAHLYGQNPPETCERTRSTEELAKILGCPVGEVRRMREKFDSNDGNISLLGRMFTSSPNIRELRDIAPYLAASWIAHRFPKTEDNARSLSSPETLSPSKSSGSTLRRNKSSSPSKSSRTKSSILKSQKRSVDPKTEPLYRYQPEPVRYRPWWPSTLLTRPSVSFQEPEPPVPPPKGLHGIRSQELPESPRKYVENEVTIHYKTPVRQEIKEYLSEDELAHRQAEVMKKIYQEERRRKYLQVSQSMQELQDMNSRRHTDNFIPSQKSPISLNRYDDFGDDLSPSAPKPRPKSPERRLLARALYNFVGQTARELTFRKGDLIYVRRQVDKNWYEGELNAMVGLFPVNYVEIVTYDAARTAPRKAHEGQARAKFNFVAQTHLELSLAKGELVVVTRRVDDNWFEGKIGGRKGIFPVSYVDLLIDPNDPPETPPVPSKPVASPAAHSLLLNGSSGGKESMGSHSYTPNLPATQLTSSSYHAKPVQIGNYGSLNNRSGRNSVDQALHIETQSEPTPYRAMYKYLPQNDDELELLEGDTVYVLEKCDDGWYVGSSDRTGAFGTFPGNYVEKI